MVPLDRTVLGAISVRIGVGIVVTVRRTSSFLFV